MPSLPIDADDSGFLLRWSRRKAQVRQGVAVAEAVPPVMEAPPMVLPVVVPVAVEALPLVAAAEPALADPPPPTAEPEPALTLDDVAALTRDSNFARFIKPGVQPEVKNAALSKLFTDPHFNVMDRLDTYIDDYGKPDPLPEGMLRKMLQAHVLGLFDHEKEDAEQPLKTELATDLPLQAQPACDAAPPTEPAADENTDLQLQPDDGAGRPGAESGAGQDAGCAH